MLEVEVPAAKGLALPTELCIRTKAAQQQQQQLIAEVATATAATKTALLEISGALTTLNVPHSLHVTQAPRRAQRTARLARAEHPLAHSHLSARSSFPYMLDVVVPAEAAGGMPIALFVLSSSQHYMSTRELTGSVQLKIRLLRAQGIKVAHLAQDEWNDLRSDDSRLSSLRELLTPLMQSQRQPPPQ
jgi:hypothetical protein